MQDAHQALSGQFKSRSLLVRRRQRQFGRTLIVAGGQWERAGAMASRGGFPSPWLFSSCGIAAIGLALRLGLLAEQHGGGGPVTRSRPRSHWHRRRRRPCGVRPPHSRGQRLCVVGLPRRPRDRSPKRGKALFPVVANPGATWGSAPRFDASEAEIAEATASGDYALLLDDLARGQPVDLLHVDIQGGETSFLADNFEDIERLVKRVLIGTHSRSIEGDIMRMMLDAGWLLEMERPAILGIAGGVPHVVVDGVQAYFNPRLG
ncbi:hypothetical protein GTW51_14520 [Aurantimonas aggregata]|uniref:Methyltransferase FkbM domain-containing protein n=1 Tax=Aurantimonas aggregata TaxID=2047720 RepID=A0A6L9MJC1_9HYPH|nr:hypothetical protein [Aurantimonas aggregata]NDV87917.1 hypothetical protein [Aurantimonas aggregata]